ncbi:MAG: ATP-binding protein [Actinomycetes bacterium]|jgi:anti-sigma regulatory factor (Ser/Thr protein kinase)
MSRVQERDDPAPDLTVPWVLPSGPSSVTLARRAARQQLADLGLRSPELLDTVELLVSELTANVVKHVGGRATLKIVRIAGVIRIEVCDANPTRVPVERDMDVDATSGRGLLLVSSLATAWGFDRDDDAKCTWAEIDLANFSPSSASR